MLSYLPGMSAGKKHYARCKECYESATITQGKIVYWLWIDDCSSGYI